MTGPLHEELPQEALVSRLLHRGRELLAQPGPRAALGWGTPAEGDVVVYHRGRITVAVNLGDAATGLPALGGEVVFDTDDPASSPQQPRPAPIRLRPQQAVVLTTGTPLARRSPTDLAGDGAA